MKKIIFLLALALFSCVCFGLEIAEAGDGFSVKAAAYSAGVSGRLLYSLEQNGREMLSGELASWLQNTWAPVSVLRDGDTVTCVKKDFGRVVYAFSDEKITVSLVNDTAGRLCYSTLLSPDLFGVVLPSGPAVYPVIEANAGELRFFAGREALVFKGDILATGPQDGCQLIELFAGPGETKTMELIPARASGAEEEKVKKLRNKALFFDEDSGIALYSPRDYQVFQRRTRSRGKVLISGRVKVPCDRLVYVFSGKNFAGHRLSETPREAQLDADGSFSFETEVAAGGWFRLSLTAYKGERAAAALEVEHVGVGEVIIASGQSNSTNRAQARMKSRHKMASATDGTEWRLCDDPMPGQHDGNEGRQGGSMYPALGDYLYEALGVPVAFASTGHGGMEAKRWLPGGELYAWLMDRIDGLGKDGFRCVIWHQGESEQFAETTADEYYDTMKLIINASVCDAGRRFPWFTAKASLMSADTGMYEPVRAAQQRLWDTKISLPGPDTDTLTGGYREYDGKGAHFTPEGLEAHARLWSYILADYINRQP
ncbi:MAG: hypothetical protein ILO36_03055 [Abditibacteriota bacterium]|nr:hypothetical protein [Abditibacteriota bacterium]